MVTWKLVGWLRMALLSIVAVAPLAQPRGPGAASSASSELAIDVDGDGRAERVRCMRHGDAWWLDVEGQDAAHQRELRSTTRVGVAVGAAGGWSLRAADVNGDGKLDVLLRDPAGHTTVWLSDGRAFAAAGEVTT